MIDSLNFETIAEVLKLLFKKKSWRLFREVAYPNASDNP